MINIQPSHSPGAVTPSNQSPPKSLVGSVTSRVIELFHDRLKETQTFAASPQPSDMPKWAQRRIEDLLRPAQAKKQTSLAEQIIQLIENSREPLTDTKLHSEVAKLLNQTSPLSSQNTYAQLIQEILENSLHSASSARRSRRNSLPVDPAPTSRNASVPPFAKALVESEDRKLALNLANKLIQLRNADEEGRTSDQLTAVPPGSSYGQALEELYEAVNCEPFKSVAEAKKIDLSNVSVDLNGWLIERRGNKTYRFDLSRNEWWGISDRVLTALDKFSASGFRTIPLNSKYYSDCNLVGSFYGLNLEQVESSEILLNIGELLHFGNFKALSAPAPRHLTGRYAEVKQRQSEAIQKIVDLPQQPLSQLLAPFAAKTAEQKVQEADQLLAQRSNQLLMRLAPGIGNDWANDISTVMLTDIPEYSTFNQARKNLLAALSGRAFTSFTQENNVEPGSVRINPVTGDMTGNVRGVETRFSPNDVSGWSDVWDEIGEAVNNMAAGSQPPVKFASTQTTSLNEVMNFYNEAIPHLEDSQVNDYRRLRLTAVLKRSAQMSQNNGFNALTGTAAVDDRSTAVRASQNATITGLSDTRVPLSPLETLAAAVDSSFQATTERVDAPGEELANPQSTLAVTMHRAMLELKTDATFASSKKIGPIWPDSLFGQWWEQLGKAFRSRSLVEWSRQERVDPASLRFDPVGGVLIGNVNGVEQRFEADDFAKKYPEHFDALEPLVRAAKALVPNGQSIMLSYTGITWAPFELVANFYGIDISDYRGSQFAATAALMDRTKNFPERPKNPAQSLNQLRRQQTALGDSNDRYALIEQLKLGITDRDALDSTARLVVDPDSSHKPKGVKTVSAFIAENGWNVLGKSADDTKNLLLALSTPLPQPATLGNNWGFLSTDISLNTAQREAVTGLVRDHIGVLNNPLRFMGNRVTPLSADPERALEQLLSSNDALELANHLQTQMKGAVTPTSLKQWLLTAAILHLDPTAGTRSNSVAGYDLMKPGNWGRPAKEILQDLTQHLITTNKALPDHAPLAAHLLLSGAAPQFLVKDLPDSLIFGSRQWVTFHTAVNRIEQISPGGTRSMSYKQVMDFNAIKPVSKAEELQLFRAQMNPVIDWGIANGVIYKNDKRPYREQLQDCRQALSKQTSEVANARNYISNHPVPVRRTLALENLKAKFGDQVPFEARALWRESDQLDGTLASVVEAYEAGKLGDTYEAQNLIDRLATTPGTSAWEAKDARIPIQYLHDSAAELPDVNAQYDAAIESDYGPRREHSIVLIKDLLTRLPAEDRNRLAYGNLQYFSVRETDTSVWTNLSSKTGKKGRHGIVIRATGADGKTSDIGIFPDAGTVKKIPGLPNPMPIGGTNANFGKVYDGADEGTHALPLDFTAFNSSSAPRDGITSNVIVDRITPVRLVNGELINSGIATFGTVNQSTAPAYSNEQLENIAATSVDSHFLRKDEYKAINHGHNQLENKSQTSLERLNYLARMIPGVTPIEDFYQGHYEEAGRHLLIDALTIFIPGALGTVWSAAANSFERVAVKLGEGIVESGVGSEAVTVALKDVTASSSSKSFESINRMQGGVLANRADGGVAPAPDLADGAVRGSSGTELLKATAVRRDGNWYAYDAKTMQPYGPAQESFVSQTSSAVKPETFSDGTQALVTEKELSADAYTVTRSTGFDLVDKGKVYRYDRRTPGMIVDLESADTFKPLEGFEAVCGVPAVGGRLRRAPNETCFSKVIEDVSGTSAKELQALEHQRLFPSQPGFLKKDQFMIFERRKYKMVDGETGPQMIPTRDGKRITYKSDISGSLKDDPQFGFRPGENTDAITKKTRVIKLGNISDAVKDTRELRGVVVDGPSGQYVVIEADTAEFYYAKLSGAPGGKLIFKTCTPNELEMVKDYRKTFTTLLGVAQAPYDANFIALPKLGDAFKNLERSGFSEQDIDELKTWCEDFSQEQQREVLYQLQRHNAIDNPTIALRPNRVSALTGPADFDTWLPEQKNGFFAREAKKSVNLSMKATGLGPGNQIRSSADSARAQAATMTNEWLRRTVSPHALNRPNLILKTGAGNCGEMALLSKDIVRKSGGRAYEWMASDAHAFTVIGGPSTLPPGTVDFSEAAWADAWVVDPWADIACPARLYTQKLKEVMTRWASENLKIMDNGNLISPLDKTWLDKLTVKPKAPYAFGYNGA